MLHPFWRVFFLMLFLGGINGGSPSMARAASPLLDQASATYNVQLYGAKCDGVTNDTGAIQSAIAAAIVTHGVVQLCAGTSLISPPTVQQVFNVTGGHIRISGCGMGCSILKLKNSAGDYTAVFGAQGEVSDMTFDNFTFDYNSSNNHPISLTRFRTLVFWSSGTNIVFDTLDIVDIDAVNVIYLGETNTTVRHCHFTLNAAGRYYHDTSILYLAGEGATVEGNYFVGSPNAAGSVTAIETHAGGQTITHNIVDGFETCANLSGVNATRDSEGVIFAENICKNGLVGAVIWSRAYGTHRTGRGVSDFSIAGNIIDIHQALWKTNPFSGGVVSAPAGIVIDSNSSLAIANLNILDNNISFDLSSAASDPYSNTTSGIGYWDASGINLASNITIKGNTVINSPGAGLYWGATCQACDFSGNTFINPGSSLNEHVNPYVRAAIVITSTMAVDIALDSETITDNLPITRMVRGFYLGAAPKSTLTASGRINVSGTHNTPYVYLIDGTDTAVPFVRITNVAPSLINRFPPHPVAKNSIIYDMPTGTYYTTADGKSWTPARPF